MGDWQIVKLGDILTESKIESTMPNVEARIRVLLNAKGVVKRPFKKETKGATKYFVRKKKQFIYGKQNLHKGAFGIVSDELDGYESTSDLPAFDVNEKCLPSWIVYYLKQGNLYLSLKKIARGAATQRIQPKELFELKIPLPSIDEQKIIITHFKSIGAKKGEIKSELTHQQILLKKLRQSILQEAIAGKLTADWRQQNPDVEPARELLARIQAEKEQLIQDKKLKKGGKTSKSITQHEVEIPANWKWCKTDQIFFVTKLAGFEYTKHIKLNDAGEIPVVRAQNVRPFTLNKNKLKFIDRKTSELLNRCALAKPSLLVTFIGAGIGDVAFFEETDRWHLAPNVAKLEPFENCEDLLSLKFLNIFLQSYTGRKEIFKHVKATAQPSLSMGTIRDIDLPIPPLPEQKTIATKVEKLLTLCDQLKTQITSNQTHAEQLMQAVLKEAFSQPETAGAQA